MARFPARVPDLQHHRNQLCSDYDRPIPRWTRVFVESPLSSSAFLDDEPPIFFSRSLDNTSFGYSPLSLELYNTSKDTFENDSSAKPNIVSVSQLWNPIPRPAPRSWLELEEDWPMNTYSVCPAKETRDVSVVTQGPSLSLSTVKKHFQKAGGKRQRNKPNPSEQAPAGGQDRGVVCPISNCRKKYRLVHKLVRDNRCQIDTESIDPLQQETLTRVLKKILTKKLKKNSLEKQNKSGITVLHPRPNDSSFPHDIVQKNQYTTSNITLKKPKSRGTQAKERLTASVGCQKKTKKKKVVHASNQRFPIRIIQIKRKKANKRGIDHGSMDKISPPPNFVIIRSNTGGLQLWSKTVLLTFDLGGAPQHPWSDQMVIIARHDVIGGDIPPYVISRGTPIAGIIGLIYEHPEADNLLEKNPLLIAITGQSLICELAEQEIYRMEKFAAFSMKANRRDKAGGSTCRRFDGGNTFKEDITTVLNTPEFYFSPTYNLTVSILKQQPIDIRHEFVYNSYLLTALLDESLENLLRPFLLPIIYGYICSTTQRLYGHTIKYTLISRRSRYRGGIRYYSRGCDLNGFCSNFVETEQIVETQDGTLNSFIMSDVQYPRPPIVINKDVDQLHVVRTHFLRLRQNYGNIVIVNIARGQNQADHEAEIVTTYRQLVERTQIPGLTYHDIDFLETAFTKGWKGLLQAVSDLYDMTKDNIGYGSFDLSTKHEKQKQIGVYRTNCIDSIDRTNVVQCVFALCHLRDVLQMSWSESEHGDGKEVFKSVRKVWSRNGNMLARQYSNTVALLTEMTLHGERSSRNAVRDGTTAIRRYFNAQYKDPAKHLAINRFLGLDRKQEGQNKDGNTNRR
ncbi:unnamed protein product [Cyprideis torosa]|uniref:Phosphatidylinositol-3-phosphatase SAC1 n=1 Tax=Cyprideis torosa TaxID=163714 RepID=A0A7R8WAV9_9CRUS|nr:unnamed protein product [Cyprideis torosa]CAG0891539.1 unnamed protein product [Cyprideis torosa]